jgi:hypothetical protein
MQPNAASVATVRDARSRAVFGWLMDAGRRRAPSMGPAQELKLAVQRRMFAFTLAFMAATAPVYLFLVARTSGVHSAAWW